MSRTETKEVTYFTVHRIVVGGKAYSTERTCRNVHDGAGCYEFACSACGASTEQGMWFRDDDGGSFSYCPSCGAKVVGE